MRKQDIVQTALDNIVKNNDDIIRAFREDKLTIVVLTDGSVGVAYRKKGDIDKPYLAAELAYIRAKEEQIIEKL